jgi:hypothetical protein
MDNGNTFFFSYTDRDTIFHTLSIAWNIGKRDTMEGRGTIHKNNVLMRARSQRFVCSCGGTRLYVFVRLLLCVCLLLAIEIQWNAEEHKNNF